MNMKWSGKIMEKEFYYVISEDENDCTITSYELQELKIAHRKKQIPYNARIIKGVEVGPVVDFLPLSI